MMLDANSTGFIHPHGATVRDRWGRRILGVMACNPETGEVISCNGTWLTGQWLRLTHRFRVVVVTRHALRWVSPSGGFLRCHGFWPAPLAIEAKQPDPAAIQDRIANATDDPGTPTLAQLDDMILAVERNP